MGALKVAVNELLVRRNSFQVANLEGQRIMAIKDFFKPLGDIITEAEGDSYITISRVIPMLIALKKQMNKVSYLCKFRKTCYTQIDFLQGENDQSLLSQLRTLASSFRQELAKRFHIFMKPIIICFNRFMR